MLFRPLMAFQQIFYNEVMWFLWQLVDLRTFFNIRLQQEYCIFSNYRNILCSCQQNAWILRELCDFQKLDYKWYLACILLWSSLLVFGCTFFPFYYFLHVLMMTKVSHISFLKISFLLSLLLSFLLLMEHTQKSFFCGRFQSVYITLVHQLILRIKEVQLFSAMLRGYLK